MNQNNRTHEIPLPKIGLDKRLSFFGLETNIGDFLTDSVRKLQFVEPNHIQAVVFCLSQGLQSKIPVVSIVRSVRQIQPLGKWEATELVVECLGRVSSALNIMRMENAGISQFQWLYSGALDENSAHEIRDQRIFDLFNPKEAGIAICLDDLPQMKYSCKCIMRAVRTYEN